MNKARRREVQTQQERLDPGNRQNFLLKVSEFQSGKRPRSSLTPGLSKKSATTGASGGLLSALRQGSEGKLLHTVGAGKERRRLSHSHVFGLVFFIEQKLLCQLPGKLLCNYCVGSGHIRSSYTRTEGGGREWPKTGSSIRPGSVPGPHPVLSQLGHLGALTKQNPAPSGPGQTHEDRGREHSVYPQETGQDWGSGVLGSSTSSRPQFPDSTANGQTK